MYKYVGVCSANFISFALNITFFYSQNILSMLMIESKMNSAVDKNRHFSQTKMSLVFLFLEEIRCCSSGFV